KPNASWWAKAGHSGFRQWVGSCRQRPFWNQPPRIPCPIPRPPAPHNPAGTDRTHALRASSRLDPVARTAHGRGCNTSGRAIAWAATASAVNGRVSPELLRIHFRLVRVERRGRIGRLGAGGPRNLSPASGWL